MEILKIKISSAQNVGKVQISRNKNIRASIGAISGNFFHGRKKCKQIINSEVFLAEVFHPWVRWEGPGSGFENSSGAGAGGAGGVWAQARPQARTQGPLGIEVEKQGFRTAWLITGQKFP